MRRLVALDGLRGLAAAMVFVFHAQLPGLHQAVPGLDAGVMIFFALSGYLLYAPFAASFRDGGRPIDLKAYAIRRFLRIAPAYLVAAFLIARIWFPDMLVDPVGIASTMRSPVIIVWTLQLEVAFYILLPFLAFGLARLRSAGRVRLLLSAAMASIGLSAIVMVVSAQILGFVPGAALSTIASYIWAFVPGMIVAELEQRGSFARELPAYVAAGGFGLIAVSSLLNPPAYFDLTASIGGALLIAYAVSQPAAGRRFKRLFVTAGALSYSVYLWHEAIIGGIARPTPGLLGTLLAAVMTLAVATLVYVLVERPSIRLGHRLRRVAPRDRSRPSPPYSNCELVPVPLRADAP